MDKLGICIPTYNREKDLETCIRHFLPQLKKYAFPIYISDNDPVKGNGTENMVARLRKEYPKLFYKKNDTRLGSTYAPNLISALKSCDAEFVWLFGDDDIVKEGAIDAIVANLDKGNDFLQVNIEVWNDDFSKKFLGAKIKSSRDAEYKSGEHEAVLSKATGGYAGYMAGVITRTQYLKDELQKLDKKDIATKDFLHTTLLYKAIVGKTGMLMSKPIVQYRTRAKLLSGRELYIWLVSFPDALNALKPDYSDKVIQRVSNLPLLNLMGIACINKLQKPQEIRTFESYLASSTNLGSFRKVMLSLTLALPDDFVKSVIYPILRNSRGLTMEL